MALTDQTRPLEAKARALSENLAAGGRTLLAYSGGLDSGFLAVCAREALGDDFLAVLADSPSLAGFEREEAEAFAAEAKLPLRIVRTHEIEDEAYRRNDADRCFHCKAELYGVMADLAAAEGFATLLYGGNWSDRMDHRPGERAARDFSVRAPLAEVGLGKDEIRELARRRGLSIWDKPARACLASRIPHFSEVTEGKLAQVALAEGLLNALGFRNYRVRHHGAIARLELGEDEWARLADPELRREVDEGIRARGFDIVALDLLPFASGRLSSLTRPGPLTDGGGNP